MVPAQPALAKILTMRPGFAGADLRQGHQCFQCGGHLFPRQAMIAVAALRVHRDQPGIGQRPQLRAGRGGADARHARELARGQRLSRQQGLQHCGT